MSNIKLFESKQIRTVWNEPDAKWYFVVADVIQVLTDTPNPSDYIKKMRKRDEELSKGWGQFVTPLSVDTTGGKQRLNCASAKGLLRIIQSSDHMNDPELIFSMLGEASTTEIVKTQNPKGFIQNKKAAKQGGAVAGNARRELESRTGKKVVSANNYLPEAKKNKELKNGKEKK